MARDRQSGGSGTDPASDEAVQRQMHLARAQGDAYGAAREHMAQVADTGAERVVGDYWIGFTVEPASGKYAWLGDRFAWQEPLPEEFELSVTVRDAGDGRYLPCARVEVTVIDSTGAVVGTAEHSLVWHPMLYRYSRDWRIPAAGDYTIRVSVQPPLFARHDQVNGTRFSDSAELDFTSVRVDPGAAART